MRSDEFGVVERLSIVDMHGRQQEIEVGVYNGGIGQSSVSLRWPLTEIHFSSLEEARRAVVTYGMLSKCHPELRAAVNRCLDQLGAPQLRLY